ncbi:hypothetical protein IE53DRAFT_364639 [Violaceomyces palustris]|uniref:Uncharacterized protein n=1 Tax=Violaceomyces palustris TaxID=1673888 RepID=A0ACD0NNT9_9BASI|nr:hypothetical protein IE53DRAFT_364639 [Violaceomyces palustris]
MRAVIVLIPFVEAKAASKAVTQANGSVVELERKVLLDMTKGRTNSPQRIARSSSASLECDSFATCTRSKNGNILESNFPSRRKAASSQTSVSRNTAIVIDLNQQFQAPLHQIQQREQPPLPDISSISSSSTSSGSGPSRAWSTAVERESRSGPAGQPGPSNLCRYITDTESRSSGNANNNTSINIINNINNINIINNCNNCHCSDCKGRSIRISEALSLSLELMPNSSSSCRNPPRKAPHRMNQVGILEAMANPFPITLHLLNLRHLCQHCRLVITSPFSIIVVINLLINSKTKRITLVPRINTHFLIAKRYCKKTASSLDGFHLSSFISSEMGKRRYSQIIQHTVPKGCSDNERRSPPQVAPPALHGSTREEQPILSGLHTLSSSDQGTGTSCISESSSSQDFPGPITGPDACFWKADVVVVCDEVEQSEAGASPISGNESRVSPPLEGRARNNASAAVGEALLHVLERVGLANCESSTQCGDSSSGGGVYCIAGGFEAVKRAKGSSLWLSGETESARRPEDAEQGSRTPPLTLPQSIGAMALSTRRSSADGLTQSVGASPEEVHGQSRNAKEDLCFNVSTILPGFLFLGPDVQEEPDVEELRKLGVKRILNVAREIEHGGQQLALDNRFEKYLKIPMMDSVEAKGVQQSIQEACCFLDEARMHFAPTYVHCKAGKSRSVTIVMAYLIHANRWSLRKSYSFVLNRRQGISPNIGFVAELMKFEEKELNLEKSGGIMGYGMEDEDEEEGEEEEREKEGGTASRP